jgi:hypothetical protein
VCPGPVDARGDEGVPYVETPDGWVHPHGHEVDGAILLMDPGKPDGLGAVPGPGEVRHAPGADPAAPPLFVEARLSLIGRPERRWRLFQRREPDVPPDSMTGWSGAALESMQRTLARVSRAGLSPNRVVAHHRKRGHDVESLSDLRSLDLEQINAARLLASGRLAV